MNPLAPVTRMGVLFFIMFVLGLYKRLLELKNRPSAGGCREFTESQKPSRSPDHEDLVNALIAINNG